MAPSRYLGLPWPEWGATDVALNMALHTLDATTHEPCGQPMDLALDPDTDGWWEVHTDTVCYACAAVEQWREDDGPKSVDKGTLPHVRLDPDYLTRSRSVAR